MPCGQDDDPLAAARRVLDYVSDIGKEAAINNDNSILQSVAPLLRCPMVAVGHLGKSNVATLACHSYRWVDYVVAISSDMHQAFVGRYGLPVTKCPVIHNGVPDPGVEVTGGERQGQPLRVVFGGGMNRRKGGHLVRKALAKAGPRLQGIELHWFGQVSDEVRKHFAGFGAVKFHGQVPRETFLEILATADVLLLPSYDEGCPMIMLEAMSYGVVPVASNGKGAMRWLVDSGLHGFICQLEHWSAQMWDALTFLRDHPGHLAAMKRATRARFLADFDSRVMTGRLVELLSNPTVDRSSRPKSAEILRWHRPALAGSDKAPWPDRAFVHTGAAAAGRHAGGRRLMVTF